MSCVKTAELIEMLFGLRTRVGPRNHALDWGPYWKSMGSSNFKGEKEWPL